MSTSSRPSDEIEASADDLGAFMDEQSATNPAYRNALEDVRELHAVLDRLVALRTELGVSQREVARRMGVSQPTVSQFETESSDPRISTLQRYARALDARFRMEVVYPGSGAWQATSSQYITTATACGVEPISHVDNALYIDQTIVDQWSAAESNRSDFVLSA